MFRLACLVNILLVLIFTTCIQAQQTGANWEFNLDDNTEGWGVANHVSDFSVSNGLLHGTITNIGSIVGSSFSGPDMNLNAENFGYVIIRMKALGATSGRIFWENNNNETGGVDFTVNNDSLFHEYEIPVNTNSNWAGQIISIQSLTIKGKTGTKINIDYIRIVTVGARFNILFFKPLRTVLKQGDAIPIIAAIQNTGDRSGSVTARLILPETFNVISENSEIQINEWKVLKVDTMQWTIQSQFTGEYPFQLQLSWGDSARCESVFELPLVDQYWKSDRIVVSTWGIPEQTEESFSEYVSAHFNKIVNIAPVESQVEFMASHNLECQVNLFGNLGGTAYLRGFDYEPAYEMNDEILSRADPIIEQFKDHPAVFGYHICDEPQTNAFENLAMVVAYLRKKDPTRLSYINLYPSYGRESHFQGYTYEEYVSRFMDIVKPELLSYDHYNFQDFQNRPDYFYNLEIIRKYACLYDIPFCNIIQGEGVTVDSWRTPTKEEFRFLNYSTLAYGGKWIVYFTWRNMKKDPLFDSVIYPSVQELNQEVLALSPVLSELRSEAVYHTNTIPIGCTPLPSNVLVQSVSDHADFVVGLMKDSTDCDYIMLMNKNTYSEATKTITLIRAVETLSCFDVSSGEWQDVSFENTSTGAEFSCTFRPGGGKLFRIGEATSAVDVTLTNPVRFQLCQNYPNPFNPATSITYSLSVKEHVELKVFNVLGAEVRTLVDQIQHAGNHRVKFDATDLANGVYIYRLRAGDRTLTRKMLIVK